MPKTPDYFVGKTIVITGAASGIGRATALDLCPRGRQRGVRRPGCADGARRTAETIAQLGRKALALPTDVTQRAQVNDAIARAIATFGTVDFLFNSAGAALRRCKFLEIDDDLLKWDVRSERERNVLRNAGGAAAHAGERPRVIVNVASMSHKRGGPGASVHYAAAKGAVLTMTLGVAREFADRGIRCLSISPGPVNTPFARAADTSPELVQKFIADVPMKRMGEPEEIGELVLFVCSDACPYMTADTVYVNGGGGWR